MLTSRTYPITSPSRCSGNEPALLPSEDRESGGNRACSPGRIKVGRRNERVRAKRCDAVDWDSAEKCCLCTTLVRLVMWFVSLSIRRCRCHWIMAAWFVFLYFFLVPLFWYGVSERQMLLFFAEGLVGVDNHLFQRVCLTTELYFRSTTRQWRCYSKTKTTKYCLKHEGKSHPCHPWQN